MIHGALHLLARLLPAVLFGMDQEQQQKPVPLVLKAVKPDQATAEIKSQGMAEELPGLNKFGYLPCGTHQSSLEAVQKVFGGGSPRREKLWAGFLRFVESIKSTEAFQAIEIGGSFLTSANEPGDIDVALELRRVQPPLDSALAVLTNKKRDQIKDEYGVQVVVKELNSEPYRPHVPADFTFATNRLPLFRLLRREDRLRVGQAERRYIPYDEEYRGVIRIDL